MRLLVSGVLIALLFATNACGRDPEQDYCGAIKDHRKELNQLADEDTQYGLIEHLPMLQDFAERAPSDIVDEWQTFLTAIEGLQAAVEETGHRPADFADAKMPADLSAEDRAAVARAADQLSSRETLAASEAIDQQVRDVCKVNLGR